MWTIFRFLRIAQPRLRVCFDVTNVPRLISLADDDDAIGSIAFDGPTATKPLCGVHDFFSVLHVVSGKIRLSWGNRMLDVTANDLVVFDPGLVNTEQSPRGLAYGIALPAVTGRALIPDGMSVVRTTLDEAASMALRTMTIALNDSKASFRLSVRRAALLSALRRSRAAAPTEAFILPGRKDAFRLLHTIRARYREPIGSRDIARAHAFAPAYATDMLRRATGRPIGAWLTAFRLHEAHRLLREGAHVGAATSAVGYTDPRYLARVFMREYGYPPSRAAQRGHRSGDTESIVPFSRHHRPAGEA